MYKEEKTTVKISWLGFNDDEQQGLGCMLIALIPIGIVLLEIFT